MTQLKNALLVCMVLVGFTACADPAPSDTLSTIAAELEQRRPAAAEAPDVFLELSEAAPDAPGVIELMGAGCSKWCGPNGCEWECCYSDDDWQLCCRPNSCDWV